jgi:hypothetical protein
MLSSIKDTLGVARTMAASTFKLIISADEIVRIPPFRKDLRLNLG